MARRRELEDALTRERYPHLVAFATLLTGDDEPAQALVDAAVVTELSRSRRKDSPAQVDEAVRARVAHEFVRGSDTGEPATPRRTVERDQPAQDSTLTGSPEPDPSVFAPPGQDPATSDDHAAHDLLGELAERDAEPPHTKVDLARALRTLSPADRAIAVLHHVDRRSLGRIARVLGMDRDSVRDRLEAADHDLAGLTGLRIPDAGSIDDDGHVDVAVTVTPARRA